MKIIKENAGKRAKDQAIKGLLKSPDSVRSSPFPFTPLSITGENTVK